MKKALLATSSRLTDDDEIDTKRILDLSALLALDDIEVDNVA